MDSCLPLSPTSCVNRNVFMRFFTHVEHVFLLRSTQIFLALFLNLTGKQKQNKKNNQTKKHKTTQLNTTIPIQCRSSPKLKPPPITVNSHKEAALQKILLPTFTRAHRSPLSESREPQGWVTCNKKTSKSSQHWFLRAGKGNQLKGGVLGQPCATQLPEQGQQPRAPATPLNSHFLHSQVGSTPLASVTL